MAIGIEDEVVHPGKCSEQYQHEAKPRTGSYKRGPGVIVDSSLKSSM